MLSCSSSSVSVSFSKHMDCFKAENITSDKFTSFKLFSRVAHDRHWAPKAVADKTLFCTLSMTRGKDGECKGGRRRCVIDLLLHMLDYRELNSEQLILEGTRETKINTSSCRPSCSVQTKEKRFSQGWSGRVEAKRALPPPPPTSPAFSQGVSFHPELENSLECGMRRDSRVCVCVCLPK